VVSICQTVRHTLRSRGGWDLGMICFHPNAADPRHRNPLFYERLQRLFSAF